jgi:hypothetical protein
MRLGLMAAVSVKSLFYDRDFSFQGGAQIPGALAQIR